MSRVLLVVALVAHGAASASAGCPALSPKTLPIARGSVVVDGVLDDATWADACFADDFEQKQPRFGAKPTHPIKVALAVDATTLYVGARMWAGSAAEIDDALTSRDDTRQAERLIVSIDPSNTKRLAYSFAVTARGVRADWIHLDDNSWQRDMSWNPVWVAQARILPDGWSVEMAIPLSQLRLPRTPAQSWGINFDWYIPHLSEDVFWRAVPPDQAAWASYFGALIDLPPIHPNLAFELMPYIASQLAIAESPTDRLAHRLAAGFEAGMDLKLRPLPGLTVTGTLNPDFGQVDADPEFVNLTAYEVRLPERRPFFVENNSLFANAGGNYFYSRRIGGLPRGGTELPVADDLAIPQQERILGALASGGYVAPQTQIAVMSAVTDRTSADAIIDGAHTTAVVSPLTSFSAARIEQQLGVSVLGATATLVERALGGTNLDQLLPSSAGVIGADARLRTCDRMYELRPYAGLTGVWGTANAITLVEEDSAHYFQRPDESHVHLDLDAHHLYGWHAGLTGAKRSGTWLASTYLNLESPGFELNDLGTLASADDIDAGAQVTRQENTPGPYVFDWDVSAGVNQSWNFGGLRKPLDINLNGSAELVSFYNFSANLDLYTPGYSDELTRGGPRMYVGSAGALTLRASTPGGRSKQLYTRVEIDASQTLQQGVIATAGFNWRALPQLRLDIAPTVTDIGNHRQYVDVLADPDQYATFGNRYLFGHLHREEASVVLRATWSLSPDLVFTLYAQPFVSVGSYDEIGELTAAGSSTVRWYPMTQRLYGLRFIDDGGARFSVAEPDYTVASVRSTAVLRWEFRPGSTLYLVWQQSRGGTDQELPTPFAHASSEIVTQPAIHTLAVKLSYWFG